MGREYAVKRVLVVDDTKNIRILLTKCLELEGYKVMTASDGFEALDLLKKESFDLTFFDIKMPEMSGTEVLKRIREMGINIPVVIITAYATIKNAIECTHLGAVAYLQKPFTADKVRNVLKELYLSSNNGIETYSIENSIKQAENAIDKKLFDDAIEVLKRIISIEPTNSYIYLLFSRAYEGIGDIEHAKKFYSMFEVLNT
jgi:DNA-binding NtrC family response regulator